MNKANFFNNFSAKVVLGIIFCGLIFFSVIAVGCSFDKSADLVVYGNIYTAEDDNDSMAEAFAVKDGKYVYVGDKEGVKDYIKEGKTEVIDRSAEGMVMPGATEGHSHYFGVYGAGLQLPASGKSYQEILGELKNQVANSDIKQFMTFGWKSSELSADVATGKNFADEIESIAPGIPVLILDNSGHAAVCNNTVLKKAGVLDNPQIRGAEVKLDKNGKPSGYVTDQGVGYLTDKAMDSALDADQTKKACEVAVDMLHEYGYTNALDAYINQFTETNFYTAIKDLDSAGQLNLNLATCYCLKSFDADQYKDKVNRVDELRNQFRTNHFNPGFIKLFVDGVVESGSGWMLDAYKNAQEGKEHGNIIWQPDELKNLIEYANSKNLLIHTHAYGDGACKAMLDAYIASNDSNRSEYRNCLGHVRNIQREDIKRAAENEIAIAENLLWHSDNDESIPSEAKQKQGVLSHISEENYYKGYPMKSLIDNGVVVSSSTDAPAAAFCTGNIQNVIEIATTGIAPETNSQAFTPSELLTVKEALKCLTINGAWQLGLENERGSIKVGKYADFLLLDKNILNYQGEQLRTIHNVKILNTFFEGKNVYSYK